MKFGILHPKLLMFSSTNVILSKNSDKSKVKGVVAKLIKVKDSSTMTALEVTAGGKLFNVVADTENTGKQLLQNGGLQRTLNKINPALHSSPQGSAICC